jgi:hypothetical protein
MLLGNSHILAQDFASVGLPTQGIAYPGSQSRWTLSMSSIKVDYCFDCGCMQQNVYFLTIQYKMEIS